MKAMLILVAAAVLAASSNQTEKQEPKQPPAPMVCAFYCGMQENGTVGCQVPPIFCRPVKGMMERFEEHLKKDGK